MADDNQPLLLQLSADIRSMEKAFDRAAGVVKKKSKEMEGSATSLEKFFGKPSLAKALDKTFDATRFKVLDSGVAKVGLFGSALENLGPIGLGAAAAIGAVTAAFAGAREAAKFADDIADTADRLHVTTDALQEYRYAIHVAGGEEKGADQALEAFSVTLGRAQAGMTKAQKGFLALGFTKAQIKGFTDVETTLPKVAAAMQGLSDAQRDAAISLLGLDGLKQLLAKGPDEMARLRDEAQKLGIVMDADLVRRGGELNDQFETLHKVIDVQLKSALVDLGPVLVELLKFAADLAREAADIADTFRTIQNRRTQHLEEQRAEFLDRQVKGGPVAAFYQDNDRKKIAEITAELERREAADKGAPPPPKPTRSLVDQSKSGSTPRDTTDQRTAQVAGQIDAAERDILRALLDFATSTEARANLQKQIVDRESAIETQRLAKQAADIQADKGITDPTKKAKLLADLKIVQAKNDEAARLQKQKIDDEAADAIAREKLELAQADSDAEADLLRVRQGLTITESEQRTIALRLVDLAYQREKLELEGIVASKTATDAEKELARIKLRQLEAAQPGQRVAATAGSSPGAQAGDKAFGRPDGYIDPQGDHDRAMKQVQDEVDAHVRTEAEAAEARKRIDADLWNTKLGMASDFFGSLAGLSESSNKTLAAIGKAAAITQATIDGYLAVQKALGSAPPPFNFVLAATVGTAAAINVAKIAGLKDGGWVDGEGGPRDDKVLRRLSRTEFVVNAGAARRHGPLLEAINSGRDLRGLLPAPVVSVAAPAAAIPPVSGGDINLHYAPNITNPEPDLMRLLERQPREFRRHLENMIRNGDLTLPGSRS